MFTLTITFCRAPVTVAHAVQHTHFPFLSEAFLSLSFSLPFPDHSAAYPHTVLAEGLRALFCFCEWTSWSSVNLLLHTGVNCNRLKTHVDLTTRLNMTLILCMHRLHYVTTIELYSYLYRHERINTRKTLLIESFPDDDLVNLEALDEV